MFAFNKIAFNPETSEIQRGIKHFFNASIRPGPPPKVLAEPRFGIFYVVNDHLCQGLYNLPVWCTSHFHSLGKGYRVLTLEELGTVHGFPRHLILPNFPSHFLELPPCQLLLASLKSIWLPLPATVYSPTISQPIKQAKEVNTWLPTLRRYLSHSWIDDSLITATASKADDAATPCRLWDARLELIFPGCTPKLGIIRDFVLGWMRHRLLREIRCYLSHTFGPGWSARLSIARATRAKGPVTGLLGGFNFNNFNKLRGGYDANANRKNLKASAAFKTYTIASDQSSFGSGDITPVINNTSKFVTESVTNKGDMLVTKEIQQKERDVQAAQVESRIFKTDPDLELDQLCVEGDKVTEVLSKFCNASWWEWDNGSALFFWRWGEEIILSRDGMVPFVTSNLPRN